MTPAARYVLFVVGGFTAGMVLAAPAVNTYPILGWFSTGPWSYADLVAATVGAVVAVVTAAALRDRVWATATAAVGALAVLAVALPNAWRFDVHVATAGAGLILGAVTARCGGPGWERRQILVAAGVTAGLLTAVPLAEYEQFTSIPVGYAIYTDGSAQSATVSWLVAAAVVFVTALVGVRGDDAEFADATRTRALLVGVVVPPVLLGLHWVSTQAATSPSGGWWLVRFAVVPVLIAAAVWLPGRAGVVVATVTAVAVTMSSGMGWSPGWWPVLLIPVVLVAAGMWAGRRWPVPSVGFAMLAVATATAVFERAPWDNVHAVATIFVVPFVAAYTIAASLPSAPTVTAAAFALPAVLTVPVVADFGWTAYTPLTTAPEGWAPSSATWWSVSVAVAAVLACWAAAVWIRRHRVARSAW